MELSDMWNKLKSAWVVSKQHFYYSGKPKSINPINYLRVYYEGRAVRSLRTKHRELFKLISEMLGKSDSTGCEFSDYMVLYDYITRKKPKYILECGSGITSALMAYALSKVDEETGLAGKLISMEENEFYFEQVKSIFPSNLSKYVEFHLSNRMEKNYGHFHSKGCYYEDVPEYPYDFVFVDGPTLKKDKNSLDCFNSDLINVLIHSSGNVESEAIIDCRLLTISAFKELLPGAKIRHLTSRNLTLVSNASLYALHESLLLE